MKSNYFLLITKKYFISNTNLRKANNIGVFFYSVIVWFIFQFYKPVIYYGDLYPIYFLFVIFFATKIQAIYIFYVNKKPKVNAISKLTNNLIILGVGSFWVPLTFLFYLDNHISQICLNNAGRKFLIATKQEIPSKWNSKQIKIQYIGCGPYFHPLLSWKWKEVQQICWNYRQEFKRKKTYHSHLKLKVTI